MSWQAHLFSRLRDREWHGVGDLFAAVERDIPLHHAMRYATHYGRQDLTNNSTARWQYYQNALVKIGIETDAADPRVRKWADHVRLAYVAGRVCEACGGPVIKATPSGKIRVVCLACERGSTAPTPVPAPTPEIPPEIPPTIIPPARPAVFPSPQVVALGRAVLVEVAVATLAAPPSPDIALTTAISPPPSVGIADVSPGWRYRWKKAMAAFVKYTRLPGTSVSQIIKQWDRQKNQDLDAFLIKVGRLPISDAERNWFQAHFLSRHPPVCGGHPPSGHPP
jgi:hypothetical protein